MPPRSPKLPKLILQDTDVRPKTLKLSAIGNSLTVYAAQELKKRYGNAKTGNKKHSQNTPGGKKPHARAYRKAMLHTHRGVGDERDEGAVHQIETKPIGLFLYPGYFHLSSIGPRL
jgi:hypothetical protein